MKVTHKDESYSIKLTKKEVEVLAPTKKSTVVMQSLTDKLVNFYVHQFSEATTKGIFVAEPTDPGYRVTLQGERSHKGTLESYKGVWFSISVSEYEKLRAGEILSFSADAPYYDKTKEFCKKQFYFTVQVD